MTSLMSNVLKNMLFYITFRFFLIISRICKNILLLLVRNCYDIKSDILFMYDIIGIHEVITFKDQDEHYIL